ncbi:MAG TPA: DUF4345 domain-containing protein [Myxococcota bacterium]|jgi:hypothetical protein
MAARVFLAFSVLLWLPYGIYCFFDPGFLAGAAGVASQSPTGSTELRAMYGGLQTAIGALALAGVFQPALQRPALVALGFLASGLALARLGGVALDGSASSYTIVGLCFEISTAALSAFLLSRTPSPGERPA